MMQVISNDLRPFVDLLILGAGWTSEFLIPLLTEGNISFAATSRDGSVRSGVETIKFQFTKESDSVEAFKVLPDAQTILISFPIYAPGESVRLVQLWNASHPDTSAVFIQLGSSGIWTVCGLRTMPQSGYCEFLFCLAMRFLYFIARQTK